MYILIVEDTKIHFEHLHKILTDDPVNLFDRIEWVKTELEFREKFESIAADPPDVVVLDVMIKWTTRKAIIAPPKEVEEEGFFRAGIRCEKMLATDDRTKHIPVIIHSVITQDSTEEFLSSRPQVRYLDKDLDAEKFRCITKEAVR